MKFNRELIEIVKELIGKGKFDAALKELNLYDNIKEDNTILALNFQYNLAMKSKIQGLITEQNFNMQVLTMGLGLINYLDIYTETLDETKKLNAGEEAVSSGIKSIDELLQQLKLAAVENSVKTAAVQQVREEMELRLRSIKSSNLSVVMNYGNERYFDKTTPNIDSGILAQIAEEMIDRLNTYFGRVGLIMSIALLIVAIILFSNCR